MIMRSIYLLLLLYICITFWGSVSRGIPQLDSSVFLYIGQRIVDGYVPYRDIFDHKPPLIFFINALGLFFSGGKIWGVWALELFFLIFSVMIAFFSLKKLFGKWITLLSTVLWVEIYSILLDGGNLTEEYALPVQFICIAIFIYQLTSRRYRGLLQISYGLLAALTFFLKQNTVGVYLAIGICNILFLGMRRWIDAVVFLRNISIGFCTVLFFIILYFFLNNSLSDFYKYAFEFNYYYSGKMFTNFANVIYRGIQLLIYSPALYLAIIGWFDIAVMLLYGFKRVQLGIDYRLLLLLFLMLPIEFILVSISGKIYTHYYLTWIPSLAILSGYSLSLMMKLYISQESGSFIDTVLRFFYPLPILIIFGLTLNHTYARIKDILKPVGSEQEIFQFLRNTSTQDDYIFVWGVGQTVNLVSSRKSPTRYIYQTPLYTKGFQEVKMYQDVLRDLKTKRPKYILDGNTNKDKFRPIVCNQNFDENYYHPAMQPLKEIDVVLGFICNNYKQLGYLINGYTVYILKDQL